MNKLLLILFLLIPIQASANYIENLKVGTLTAYYFDSRKAAVTKCKNEHWEIGKEYAVRAYIKYSQQSHHKYKGLRFIIDVEKCDDLPQHSICIDDNNCLIVYGDERKGFK